MIIDIKKIKKEMLYPILLQAVSASILVSVLISKTVPTMNFPSRIIIERILGIGNQFDSYTILCEVFIKISIFVFIQFIFLSLLFKVFAEILCKNDVPFLDTALIICKPALISALLLICGVPWLFITPAAVIPYIFASFIITLLYNYTATCSTLNINMNKGILLTTSVYLIYFTFIWICIMKA